MEHGSDGQNRVEMAHAKDFAEATSKGVQHQRAVGIDDTFGMTGRARGEAHGCAVVFVELRITKVVASIGEKEFVIYKPFRHSVGTMRNHNHFFEGSVAAELFVNGKKDVVDQQEAVAGMLCDSCNFMGMEPQIQRMQNATGTRNAEEGFQMCGVVPHHGGYAVACLQ